MVLQRSIPCLLSLRGCRQPKPLSWPSWISRLADDLLTRASASISASYASSFSFLSTGSVLVVIGAVSEPGVRGPTHVLAAFPTPLYGRRHQPTTERPLRPQLQPIFSWGPDSQLPVSREPSLAGPLPLLGVMPVSTAHDVRWARCSSSAKHHFRGLFHVMPASPRRRNWTIGGYCRPGYFHDDLPSCYLRAARARRRHYRHPG